jgi:hypothetical protein
MQIMLAKPPANFKQNLGQVLMQQKSVLEPKRVRTRKKIETWTLDSCYWHRSYYKGALVTQKRYGRFVRKTIVKFEMHDS